MINAAPVDFQIVVVFTSFSLDPANYLTIYDNTSNIAIYTPIYTKTAAIGVATGSNKYPRFFSTPGNSLTLLFHATKTTPFIFTANYSFVPILNSTITCPSSSISDNVIQLNGGSISFNSIPPTTGSRTWAFWWMTPSQTKNE